MKLDVNATRMELLRLKKRLGMARKGHKLLKDKQDELMRNFLEVIEHYKILRQDIEKEFAFYYRNLIDAYSFHPREILESVFSLSDYKLNITEKKVPIMNLRVPKYEITESGSFFSYGFFETSACLDSFLLKLSELTKMLIKLGEFETTITKLAIEIEKTKHRVNALEYILIPNLVDTIKYIGMKISEVERSGLSRLMKIKEIVRSH